MFAKGLPGRRVEAMRAGISVMGLVGAGFKVIGVFRFR